MNNNHAATRAKTWSAFLVSATAFALSLWIVAPAPARFVWLWAVAASEWGLWLTALGLVGAVWGFVLTRRGGQRWLSIIALLLGLSAAGCGLWPTVSAWRVARAEGVSLSAGRYFLGWRNSPTGPAPQTVEFAQVAGQSLKLDVYLPNNGNNNAQPARPALIVIHGGGWDSGDKSDFPQWNQWFTQQGYAVFDIQYRLQPQPDAQTATGDVKCAIGWVKRNAARYQVDPQRVALLGRSAGGHLALLAGYTAGSRQQAAGSENRADSPQQTAGSDKADGKSVTQSAATGLASTEELPADCAAEDIAVQAVIAFYAPTDLIWAYENPANQRVIDGPTTISNFVGGTPQNNAAAYRVASPVNHVNAQTPPTLLLHGGMEQLVLPENMAFLTARLQAGNVPHKVVLLPYAQHGFDYNFHGWGSQIVQPVILQFLQDSFQRSGASLEASSTRPK